MHLWWECTEVQQRNARPGLNSTQSLISNHQDCLAHSIRHRIWDNDEFQRIRSQWRHHLSRAARSNWSHYMMYRQCSIVWRSETYWPQVFLCDTHLECISWCLQIYHLVALQVSIRHCKLNCRPNVTLIWGEHDKQMLVVHLAWTGRYKHAGCSIQLEHLKHQIPENPKDALKAA